MSALISKVLEGYMDYTLEHEKRPLSVYKFCKTYKIKEGDFYKSFANLSQVEETFWKQLINSSFETALKHCDENADSSEKLLNFYYVLLENMNLNRSFILFVLEGKEKLMKTLSIARKPLLEVFKALNSNFKPLEIISDDLSAKVSDETLFLQFIAIVKFWTNDSSLDKEKTEALVEKSIRLLNDVNQSLPIDSFMDLGKFILGEIKSFR